jgi:hypothetical protein
LFRRVVLLQICQRPAILEDGGGKLWNRCNCFRHFLVGTSEDLVFVPIQGFIEQQHAKLIMRQRDLSLFLCLR